MPAFAHLLCHWLFGAHTAWLTRNAPSLRQHLLGWPLMLALAASDVLLVPLATFQARMYPSLAAGYAFNPEMHPRLFANVGPITLVLVLSNLWAVVVGFVLARQSLLRGNRLTLLLPVAIVLCTLGGYLVSLGSRAFAYGSYSALWTHEAGHFADTPSAWCVPLAYATCSLIVARVARWAGDRPLHWP